MSNNVQSVHGQRARVAAATTDMKTRIFEWNDDGAADLVNSSIVQGGIAVIPTETIYGLTCSASDEDAVRRLYRIKGRDMSKPSAVFIAKTSRISDLAEINSATCLRVIEKFLPGPLTVILKSKRTKIPGVVGNDGKIGIRVSSHPFVTEICTRVDVPLIATSANRSGQSDCRTAQEVLAAFSDVLTIIVLDSSSTGGPATTVVDLSTEMPTLVRQGTIPFSEVLNCAEGIS